MEQQAKLLTYHEKSLFQGMIAQIISHVIALSGVFKAYKSRKHMEQYMHKVHLWKPHIICTRNNCAMNIWIHRDNSLFQNARK